MEKIKKSTDDEEQREHQQQQSSSDEEYLEATGKLLKEHQLQQVATKQVILPRRKLDREGDEDGDDDGAVSAAACDYNKEPTSISTASTLQMSDTLRSRRRLFSKNCGEGDQTHYTGIAEGGFSRVRKISSRWFSELFGGGGKYSAAQAPDDEDEDNKDIVTTLECDNYNSNNDILKVDAILWTEVDSSRKRKRRVRDEREDVAKNELMTGAGCIRRSTANYLRDGEQGSETFEMKNVFPSNYNGNCSVNLALDRDNGDDYYNNRRLYDGPGAIATSRQWGHTRAEDRDRENFEEVAKINFSSNTTASTSYSRNGGGAFEALSVHPLHYYQTHCYPDRMHLPNHHRQALSQHRWDCDEDVFEGEEAEAQWNGRTVSLVEDAPGQTSTTAGRKYEEKPGSGKRRRRRRHDYDGAGKGAEDHHGEKSSRNASVSEYCCDDRSSTSSGPGDGHEEKVSVALSGRTSQEGSTNWRSGRQKRRQYKLKPIRAPSESEKNKDSRLDGDYLSVDNQQLGPKHGEWVSDGAGNENREEGKEEERDAEEEELQYFINHYDTNNNITNNNNQRDQDGNFGLDKEVAGLVGGSVGGWFALPLGRSRSRKLKGKDKEKNRKFYYSKIAVRE